MTAALQSTKDIILLTRDWWSDKTESLEPEDPGWWYTVTKTVKFRECEVCKRRRGDDLDEETKASLNRNCRGCSETFQEPTKQKRGRKKTGRVGTPSEKRKTITQKVSQREQRPRLHDDRNKSMNEEGEPDDIFRPDETQGYICVSTDPRRSGTDEGGEDFSLTTKELRKLLRTQCETGIRQSG